MAKMIGDKHRGDTKSGIGAQPDRDGVEGVREGGIGGREEGLSDDGIAERIESVPQEGLDPELDEFEDEADPDHDATGDDRRL